jgi:hypothetical protein
MKVEADHQMHRDADQMKKIASGHYLMKMFQGIKLREILWRESGVAPRQNNRCLFLDGCDSRKRMDAHRPPTTCER